MFVPLFIHLRSHRRSLKLCLSPNTVWNGFIRALASRILLKMGRRQSCINPSTTPARRSEQTHPHTRNCFLPSFATRRNCCPRSWRHPYACLGIRFCCCISECMPFAPRKDSSTGTLRRPERAVFSLGSRRIRTCRWTAHPLLPSALFLECSRTCMGGRL